MQQFVKLTKRTIVILSDPASSSINSPALPTSTLSLINKLITTQNKTIVKPELIPINQKSLDDSNVKTMGMETLVESSLKNIPIIISKSPSKSRTVQNQAKIIGVVLDKNQKINTTIIDKPTIEFDSVAPTSKLASKPTSAQIRVLTASGMKTVHVLLGPKLIKPQQSGQLGVQATLVQTSRAPLSLTANQIFRPQQTKVLPPLVVAQSPTNHRSVIPSVIPISIAKNFTNINESFQPVVAETTKSISPKTIKTSTVSILASTNNLQQSLLQSQNPQIVTVSGNKIIIQSSSTISHMTSDMTSVHSVPSNSPEQINLIDNVEKSVSDEEYTAQDDNESEVTSSTDVIDYVPASVPEPDLEPNWVNNNAEDVMIVHEKDAATDLNSIFPHLTPP